MGLDFGQGLMTRDANKDAKKREKAAQDETDKRGLFGSIGGLLGTFLPVLLAPVTGGLSLAAGAVFAGVSSAAGQAIGRAIGDSQVDDIKTKFGQSDTADMYDSLQDMDNGAILKAGLTSAVSAYINPTMSTLSDSAKIKYATRGLTEGSEAYNNAISALNLPGPADVTNVADIMAPDELPGSLVNPNPYAGLESWEIPVDEALPPEFSSIAPFGNPNNTPQFGTGFNPDQPAGEPFAPIDLFVNNDAYGQHVEDNARYDRLDNQEPDKGLLGLSEYSSRPLTGWTGW